MNRPSLDGILLVDKPAEITSAGAVREVKRRLGVAKIGHLGTLDPFATGLLPLALGEGSKVVPFLNQEDKAYAGTIALGRATDTLDLTGETTETASVPQLSAERLEDVAIRFQGDIEQVPPMFSALKRGGVPLYKLARRGADLELEPRSVCIHSLTLSLASECEIALSVRCSKGTYVRALARDIARALGSVGHLSSLRRTEFGPFRLSNAVPLEAVSRSAIPQILSPREALVGIREIEVLDELVDKLRLGQQRGLAELPAPDSPEELAKIVGVAGDLAAIVGAEGSRWKILRVFSSRGGGESTCRRP